MQPLLCLTEDVSLNWAKQHVFQHGVVCDQDVRAMLLDFMPRQQFGIAWLRFQPFRPIPVATYLAYVLSRPLFLFFSFVRRIERLEVFTWPLTFLLQQFPC